MLGAALIREVPLGKVPMTGRVGVPGMLPLAFVVRLDQYILDLRRPSCTPSVCLLSEVFSHSIDHASCLGIS